MILIVGGAYQGKTEAALAIAGIPDDADRDAVIAHGRKDPLEAAFERKIVCGFHEYIRDICDEAENEIAAEEKMKAFVEELRRKNPDAVVVANELGCGIVPMDAKDRLWREMTGDACQLLAKYSDEVYRVVCGIPQRLKGGAE